MTRPARLYTPSEAAAVSGLRLKAVNNLIDKHIVDVAPPIRGGRAPRRYLTHSHLLCMRLEHFLAGSLPVERRQRLFEEVAAHPNAKMVKASSVLHVDVAEARKDVDARVRDLEEAEAWIHSDPAIMGGEPVFKGTRIPVYSIAAMLDAGADCEDLLSGYGGLDVRKLNLAQLWVAAHPRRGRPKRLLDRGVTPTSSKRISLKGDPLKIAKDAVGSR
ncbi:DUF433 domain-containing protein [Phenylobacterium sp. Root700]|uniref:DUF433 domain-containing protein n=1 Tax=Phenylobacterium sp. Root700 TaxID=1736591 RepID=UPI0007020808|nr:DUF433 domain-containing protein [Phenylobacterium sp. Root700]KRB42053.1 hypothetical protein ASE02_04375 [Phenylobacterium sp. Root700]